jgi:hypothetical protein
MFARYAVLIVRGFEFDVFLKQSDKMLFSFGDLEEQ